MIFWWTAVLNNINRLVEVSRSFLPKFEPYFSFVALPRWILWFRLIRYYVWYIQGTKRTRMMGTLGEHQIYTLLLTSCGYLYFLRSFQIRRSCSLPTESSSQRMPHLVALESIGSHWVRMISCLVLNDPLLQPLDATASAMGEIVFGFLGFDYSAIHSRMSTGVITRQRFISSNNGVAVDWLPWKTIGNQFACDSLLHRGIDWKANLLMQDQDRTSF